MSGSAKQPTGPAAPPGPAAVVLLSGGLDSATALAVAVAEGFRCHTLAFDYSQRHRHELRAAEQVSRALGAHSHWMMSIDVRAFGGSALTGNAEVPKGRSGAEMAAGIPVTYVPARNLVFLSLAAAYAESLGAATIFTGVNAVDYSGYPDCRPEFIESMERTINLATKAGVEGTQFQIRAPLIQLSKAEIIRTGLRLGVDYLMTHSCYDPIDGLACGQCDSCQIRRSGFAVARVPDMTRYAVTGAGHATQTGA